MRYGGNTACVSVEIDDRILVLDAGTGIRSLGYALKGTDEDIFILLTHPHADHVMGFPFFEPLYEPGRVIHLFDYQHADRSWSLVDLLDSVLFPMPLEELCCSLRQVAGDPITYLQQHGLDVTRLALNHPGGAYGYRIAWNGRTYVHMTDNEIDSPHAPHTTFEEFVQFCRHADVLCHDAQYGAQDVPAKQGWGHSVARRACELAAAAAVDHLVLFHHDPDRTDGALDALQALAEAQLRPDGIACTVAYEGLEIELS